ETEIEEPGVLLVIAQGSEPHLPIQPRLMRLDEPGTLFHITWFVFEFVVEPVSAILAALHDDLRPGGGHDSEQSISVEAPEGGQPLIDRGHRGGPGDAQTEHERELDQRN